MNAYATFLIGATILLLLLIYVGTAVHKTKRLVGTLLIALTAASSLLTIQTVGLSYGIDLQGGSEFIVELKGSWTSPFSPRETPASSFRCPV
jgi:SecD/SecF fusion protein